MKTKFFILTVAALSSLSAFAHPADGRYAILGKDGTYGELTLGNECRESIYRNWEAAKGDALAGTLATKRFECRGNAVVFDGETLAVDAIGNLTGKRFRAIKFTANEPFEIGYRMVDNGSYLEAHSLDRDCDAVVVNHGSADIPRYFTTSALVCGYLDAEKKHPFAAYHVEDMRMVCRATADETVCD